MTALGRSDALSDPRFADWPNRSKNEPALRAIIEEALARDSARNWEKFLTEADVPCAAIWPISEIVHHPQLEHREVMQEIAAPYGELRLAGSGFRLEHDAGGIDRPPPLLGEHADEILTEIGYNAAEIAAFREDGVV
jgi:crotonobetainyl-CoA:carnitine CoA-transferase CaiB-like acyl-CoA transferase